MSSLTTRWPAPSPGQLLAGFVPPPHFARATFDTYVPQEASQARAVGDLRAFVASIDAPRRRGLVRRSEPLRGRYLDGGFGVGKTHLLAALWHAVDVPAAFGTFVGYTNLVGALGFARVVDALAEFRLVCIDEFELDDPGDTVLMSTLCSKLVERGVVLAATSNTLPGQLGEGRFAADDFLREIQGLASHFDTLRIDGDDYRHRAVSVNVTPWTDAQVHAALEGVPGAVVDRFDALLAHLGRVHPSHFRELLRDVQAVGLTHVHTVHDQSDALRLVVLIDRMYDLEIPVYASGVDLDHLFAPELLEGGYRKKYSRALSRIGALHA